MSVVIKLRVCHCRLSTVGAHTSGNEVGSLATENPGMFPRPLFLCSSFSPSLLSRCYFLLFFLFSSPVQVYLSVLNRHIEN